MARSHLIVVALTSVSITLALASPARAADSVIYEVISNEIATANIEYYDLSQRKILQDVPLPWRTSVTVVNAHSASTDGAELRADWRSSIAGAAMWQPNKWVTVRIYIGGSIICENTLDVGNAACYGSTSYKP